MDSASSSEDDEYEQPTQQKQKGAFKNDAEAFPDFGGGATQVQPDCRFHRRRNNMFSSTIVHRHRQLRKWTSRRLGVPPKHLQPCHRFDFSYPSLTRQTLIIPLALSHLLSSSPILTDLALLLSPSTTLQISDTVPSY